MSSNALCKGGKWRFVGTINGNIYLHAKTEDYAQIFPWLPSPMLPSERVTSGSATQRQTFTITTLLRAMRQAKCTDVAVVCYGLKQPLDLTQSGGGAGPCLFDRNQMNPELEWIDALLSSSLYFTLDVGIVYAMGGDSLLMSRPGPPAGGLLMFEVNAPLQAVSRVMSYLKEHGDVDPAASNLPPGGGWTAGTLTACSDFLARELGCAFSVAGNGTRRGYNWYRNGLRIPLTPTSADGNSGVAGVNIYNNHTRHQCVACHSGSSYETVGSRRKKNRSPAAAGGAAAAAAAGGGPGAAPPWGVQQQHEARQRHAGDLKRDHDALTNIAQMIRRVSVSQSGGLRIEAKVVSVDRQAYAFEAAVRDGYLAALHMGDTNKGRIRLNARVAKSVSDEMVSAAIRWAHERRSDEVVYAHLLQGAVSAMGTSIWGHSAMKKYFKTGRPLQELLQHWSPAALRAALNLAAVAAGVAPAQPPRQSCTAVRSVVGAAAAASADAGTTGTKRPHGPSASPPPPATPKRLGSSSSSSSSRNSSISSAAVVPCDATALELLESNEFFGTLIGRSVRLATARELMVTHPQELLDVDATPTARFDATSTCLSTLKRRTEGREVHVAAIYISAFEGDGYLDRRRRLVLSASPSYGAACFSLNLWHAYLFRAYSEVISIPDDAYGRMGFKRGAGGRRSFRFDKVVSIDRSAPAPGHISPEAWGVANSAASRIKVWSIFADGNAAVAEQIAMVPPDGAPPASDALRVAYVAKGREAAEAFHEFRCAAADFTRARYLMQCHVLGRAPHHTFFEAKKKKAVASGAAGAAPLLWGDDEAGVPAGWFPRSP
jgi:hypothetical protein